MAPKVQVIRNVPQIPGKIAYGSGTFTDLAGSDENSEKPIVAGVWHLDNVTEPSPAFAAEWDEIKYVLTGEMVLKDETTGEEICAQAGDFVWFPVGCKTSLVRSNNISTVYTEQRHAEWGTQIDGVKHELEDRRAKLINWYTETNPKSATQVEAASVVLPGGNTRTVLHSAPFPLVLESGQGTTVTSVDGYTYTDFVSEYSAAIYGHSHPAIHEAVHEALAKGINLGSVIAKEAELGCLIQERFPTMELLRFTNSGTEANTLALAAALAHTKRDKVLVFTNGYHGSTLTFGGSNTSPVNLPHKFVVGRYNDIEQVRTLLHHTIGAILVEPLQSAGGIVRATQEFLQFLRDASSALNAVLIFDEVVTSRLAYHGMQGLYNIKPDMTTLGKYVGGGFSFGCFGGRTDIMRMFDPRMPNHLSHSGTYNNNIFTMTAGVAGMKLVTEAEIERLNALGDRARSGVNELAGKQGLHDLKAIGYGSAIGLQFRGSAADALKDVVYFELLKRGIMIARRGFLMLNLIHTDGHIDDLLAAFSEIMSTLPTIV